MCSEAEWKECAERRLVENLALRVTLAEIEQLAHRIGGGFKNFDVVTKILQKIKVAKEVGK